MFIEFLSYLNVWMGSSEALTIWIGVGTFKRIFHPPALSSPPGPDEPQERPLSKKRLDLKGNPDFNLRFALQPLAVGARLSQKTAGQKWDDWVRRLFSSREDYLHNLKQCFQKAPLKAPSDNAYVPFSCGQTP